MIELIFQERCTSCGDCARACPRNVIEIDGQGLAHVARQADCQTCFMCELYCRADAIYVHPDCEKPVAVDRGLVLESGLLGQLRRHSGWHEWQGVYPEEHWRMEEVFRRAYAAEKVSV